MTDGKPEITAATENHLTPQAKADLAEDKARFVYRRSWAFRLGLVGVIGLLMSSVAVLRIMTDRKAEGMWDALAIAIIPVCWLVVALLPGIIWATNAKAVDIARIVGAASGNNSTES